MKLSLLTLPLIALSAASLSAGTLPELVANLSSEDFELRQEARLDLRQKLADAGQKELAIYEVELLEYTGEAYPMPARLWVVRMLELFGDRNSVNVLAGLLRDADIELRDCARRALVANPDPHATLALEAALDTADIGELPGLLDALAYRGKAPSVPAIARLLKRGDLVVAEVQVAAAMALGKIGGAEAREALLDAHGAVADPVIKAALERAILNSSPGHETALALSTNGQDDAIRMSAFHELLRADSVAARHLAEQALADTSMQGRASILRAVLESPIHGVMLSGISSLAQEDQLLALGAISDKRLSLYEDAVLELLADSSGELREAVVLTLGRIGSDTSFGPLYELYLADSDNEALAAALSRLRAPAADETLMRNARDGSDPDRQVAAFQLLALRNTPGAMELANEYASAGNPDNLRKAAFSALEQIGNMESVRILLSVIVDQDGLMRDAQRSLKRRSNNMGIPEFQWESAYEPALTAASSDETRKGVLAILDGISCSKAAKYLGTLISSDSPLRADALRSLSRWTDISAGEIWLELAVADGADEATIASSLRGLQRVLTTESVAGDGKDKVDLAIRAIQQAPNAGFKMGIVECYLVEDPEAEVDEAIFNWSSNRELRKRLPELLEDPDVGEALARVLDYAQDDN